MIYSVILSINAITCLSKYKFYQVFGVIYVVDGCETSRFEESENMLKNAISEDDLKGKPLLVILNKKDQVGCVDEITLSDRLHLHQLANLYSTQIRVVSVCQSKDNNSFLYKKLFF